MARVDASLELLARRDDVWAFLAEPYHLSDWWPNIAAVVPDRRGLNPGARWKVRRGLRPGLFRKPAAEETLVVREVDAPNRVAWQFTGERLDVDVGLEPRGRDRTLVTLTVSSTWLLGFRRSLPKHALVRLHALIQTAATL